MKSRIIFVLLKYFLCFRFMIFQPPDLYANATVAQRKRRGLYPQPNHVVQHPLWKHLNKVSRALAKVVANLEDLENVRDYLQVLGKIHHQAGVKVSKKLMRSLH